MQASNPSVSFTKAHFFGAAGDADRAASRDLGELTHDLADRAGSGRYHHGLAGLRLPRHRRARNRPSCPACRARRWPWRSAQATRSTLRMRRARADGILLPAEPVLDDVADLEAGMVRFHDLADSAAGHHLADADRRRVGSGVAHAPAHVGIERHVDDTHQHLARPRARAPALPRRGSQLRPLPPGGRRARTTRRCVFGIILGLRR